MADWIFFFSNSRVCVKKSTQERFALKILLDRPKARNEVWPFFAWLHKYLKCPWILLFTSKAASWGGYRHTGFLSPHLTILLYLCWYSVWGILSSLLIPFAAFLCFSVNMILYLEIFRLISTFDCWKRSCRAKDKNAGKRAVSKALKMCSRKPLF